MSQQINFFASRSDTQSLFDFLKERSVRIVAVHEGQNVPILIDPSYDMNSSKPARLFLVPDNLLPNLNSALAQHMKGSTGPQDFEWMEYVPSVSSENGTKIKVGRLYWARGRTPDWAKAIIRWVKQHSRPLPQDPRFKILQNASEQAARLIAWAGVAVENPFAKSDSGAENR